MRKPISETCLAICFATFASLASAGDSSPLSRVYAIPDMQYPYQKGDPTAGAREQARYDRDRAIRANEVIKSGVSLQLKRLAVIELQTLRGPIATQGMAEAYRQAQAMDDSNVEVFVARAVWNHASWQEFRSPEANALMAKLSRSRRPEVQAIGQLAAHDARIYAQRNRNPGRTAHL
ncbi:MAG: hypothetical protein NT117_10540 [Gammaproteobacteria bacterium]|nr:hypothetical protein [Gammaproteobacteria bacterium]